mmetsp:Transcript_33144/g.55553  ORF Transcript_33144/g.55553 Transcript_33144/m.55553 type:complete len:271 (+) Transcript_33144:274-1086(+)
MLTSRSSGKVKGADRPCARSIAKNATILGSSSISLITIWHPTPLSARVPAMSMRACESVTSAPMWLPPTYPTMSPIAALDADPTPLALSSTAIASAGSTFSVLAASRYTAGSGLKRGGVKSLSPEWIFSAGKYFVSSAATTDTGTRGLPLVVAMALRTPRAISVSRVACTPVHAFASVASASTVSSFCIVRKSACSLASPDRNALNVGRPNFARATSTTASTAGSSDLEAFNSEMEGRPALARASSTTSTMCSNALPALSRMNSLQLVCV